MGNNSLFLEDYILPPKLPKEEMYELLAKMNIGDMNARKKLIEHNIRLVIYEVNGRFNKLEHDKSELVSIGILGLVKAIDTFDLSKKVEFSSYAIRCIDNEILMFIRKLKKEYVVESLDKTVNHPGKDKDFKLEDTLSSDIDIEVSYENKEVYEQIRKIVYSLPEREREIIMLHFGFYDGKVYTQKEIAKRLNVSQAQVSRLTTRIVNDIRIKLERIDIVDSNLEIRKKKTINEDKQKQEEKVFKKTKKEGI